MKITGIETFTVGAGWKNWLFVQRRIPMPASTASARARSTASSATTEAGVHELEHLAIGQDPRRIKRAGEAHARQRLAGWRPYPSHGHRGDRGRLLGHPRQVARRAGPSAARRPGSRQRPRLRQRLVPRPSARRRLSSRPRRASCWPRASRRSSSIRSAPRRASSSATSSISPTRSAGRCAKAAGATRRILIDVHARFTGDRGAAGRRDRLAPLDIYWWEEPTIARPPGDGARGGRRSRRSRSRPARCTTRSASSSRSPRAAA